MAADAGNTGMNMLAQTLRGQMRMMGERPPALDFGTIQGDMSLLTNKFPLPIPQRDYMVCRSVQWGEAGHIAAKTQSPGKAGSGRHRHGADGAHTHPGVGYSGEHGHLEAGGEMEHAHDTLIGAKFRWLEPGDRVLVAWVGDDACVVDLVYPATRIGRDADGHDQ